MYMDPLKDLGLTEKELELIDTIEFDRPNLISDEESLDILSRMIISFKEDKDGTLVTEENIQSLSYLFNKFLSYISLRRIDMVLIEMFMEGEAFPSLNDDDEWEWMLSPDAEEFFGLNEDGDEE